MKRSCVLLLAAFLLFPVSAFPWSAGGGVGIVSPITIDLAFQNNTGPEKITNGAMGAATGWTVGADWSIGGGLATKAAGGVSTLAQTSANMVTPLVVGEVYLLVYTLDTTVTTGGLTPSAGGWTGTNQTADGTYREYFRASSTAALTFTPGNANLTCTLDNVSLKKVATQAADQVAVWVEDEGGTAGKAGLYVRGEDGGVIGLAGEVLTFGSLDGDVTLTHSANTLTLAGGSLYISGAGSPALRVDGTTGANSSLELYTASGNSPALSVYSGSVYAQTYYNSTAQMMYIQLVGNVNAGVEIRNYDAAVGLTILSAGTAGFNTQTPLGVPHAILSATEPALFGGDQTGSYTTVTFPTANKDYANKTGIGTANAAGNLLIVTGGTGATTGMYRIIAIVGANSVQVDRDIHAAVADITDGAVSTAEDVVAIAATDGTNGQRIMNYSAQNKPLQLGGDTLATTSGLTAADVVFGGMILQFGSNSATPLAGTLKGADGVGTNIAGGDFAIEPGTGTGTGSPGRGYLRATVQTGSGSGAQTGAEVASWGSSNGADRGLRYLTDIISQGGAGADTTESVRNGYIRVTAAATRTLPAGTIVGQTVNYVSTTAAVVSVDVASGSDYIILNGTALAAGFKATSDGTVGAMLTCVNDVANYWRCQAVQGVWSDGGA